MSPREMRLGVVMMEEKYAVEAGPEELATKDVTFPWVLKEDRDFWPIPIQTAIARGANADTLLGGDDSAASGVLEAAKRLDGKTQLILGNCGFMWTAAERVATAIGTPTLTSGLEFVDLALRMTNQPIGVITYSEDSVRLLLENHEQRSRILVLGLDDMPDWAVLRLPDWWDQDEWSFDGLREQLINRLSAALTPGGTLDGASILILECTVLPNFRSDIRATSGLPVLDIVSFAAGALS